MLATAWRGGGGVGGLWGLEVFEVQGLTRGEIIRHICKVKEWIQNKCCPGRNGNVLKHWSKNFPWEFWYCNYLKWRRFVLLWPTIYLFMAWTWILNEFYYEITATDIFFFNHYMWGRYYFWHFPLLHSSDLQHIALPSSWKYLKMTFLRKSAECEQSEDGFLLSISCWNTIRPEFKRYTMQAWNKRKREPKITQRKKLNAL